MSSPPPPPTNPLKRPSISSTASQPVGKKQRTHPLRQTSFPTSLDAAERSFGPTSDAGSLTGSFTGSLGGASGDGIFAAGRGKKRGRKSKAEKERERERDDALSSRGGDARLGSADADGSVRGGMNGGGGGPDDGDDDDDDDEGELFGREEGTTDTEAEKKNLAYVSRESVTTRVWNLVDRITDNYSDDLVYWLMLLTRRNPNDMTYTSESSFGRNRFAVLSTMRFRNPSQPVWLLRSTVSPRSSLVR